MIYFSHPTGNANSRAVLNGLYEQQLLSRFFTTIAVYPNSLLAQVASIPGMRDLYRRQYDQKFYNKTNSQPFYEMGRLLSSKVNWQRMVRHEQGLFSIDRIMQRLDQKVATQILQSKDASVKGVYAYEDGALHSFLAAQKKGLKKIYDLPIGYWRSARAYLLHEKERWPEWAMTMPGFLDSDEKLNRKDQELKLADLIFVASSFTASTLENYPDRLNSIHIVPYGFPQVHQGFHEYYNGNNRKLKLLYVGGLTQRKGIADIFKAVDQFRDDVELTVVGQKTTQQCKALDDSLAKHTYIPTLPHQQILALMRTHDVLLFPSLFEGFGLVITEAMSQGMSVITTDRTAGPDVIQSGKNGWLIEAANTNQLENAIKKLLDHPLLVEETGMAAIHSAETYNWDHYSSKIAAVSAAIL